MELGEQKLDEVQLRALSTVDLVKQALGEVKLLARAEILHAKSEMREGVAEAKTAAIFVVTSLALVTVALSMFFGAIVFALPLAPWLAFLLVGVVVLAAGGVLGWLGLKHIPSRLMHDTTERLKTDVLQAREEIQ